MRLSKDTLTCYEAFLSTLRKDPAHAYMRQVEMNLYGALNPSGILNRLYFEEGRWLGFEDFFRHYLSLHGETIRRTFRYEKEEDFIPGLKARLYRTQFGFLTEYHAFLLSAVFFGSENVHRSVALDRAGVDFQVRLNGKTYNIHIFVDTERSWKYRRIKSEERGVDGMPGMHVNLPYSLQEGRFNSVRYLPNRFGVYREEYLRYFVEEMKAGRVGDNNIVGTTGDGFVYR